MILHCVVLQLTHNIPLAGHLVAEETLNWVLQILLVGSESLSVKLLSGMPRMSTDSTQRAGWCHTAAVTHDSKHF